MISVQVLPRFFIFLSTVEILSFLFLSSFPQRSTWMIWLIKKLLFYWSSNKQLELIKILDAYWCKEEWTKEQWWIPWYWFLTGPVTILISMNMLKASGNVGILWSDLPIPDGLLIKFWKIIIWIISFFNIVVFIIIIIVVMCLYIYVIYYIPKIKSWSTRSVRKRRHNGGICMQ